MFIVREHHLKSATPLGRYIRREVLKSCRTNAEAARIVGIPASTFIRLCVEKKLRLSDTLLVKVCKVFKLNIRQARKLRKQEGRFCRV